MNCNIPLLGFGLQYGCWVVGFRSLVEGLGMRVHVDGSSVQDSCEVLVGSVYRDVASCRYYNDITTIFMR